MRAAPALLLLLAAPATAQSLPIQQQVAAKLAEAGPGVRFGLVVTDEAGRELVAVNPDQRFIPASNTKILVSATAFATLPGIDQPDAAGGASVRIEEHDVILEGHGDARLSSAADCTVDCLATLADAVAAKTRKVRDVVGDDTLFPDERWSLGMSWNNIPYDDGTGISALTLDDNELHLSLTPGKEGAAPQVAGLAWLEVLNQAVTVPAGGKTAIEATRLPGERRIRIAGTIAADAPPRTIKLGIDDPAEYAAWRLKALLEARGVKVTGTAIARHRPLGPGDDPAQRDGTPPARPPRPEPLAALTPPPLAEDIGHLVRDSQNLHAELLLRRAGLVAGTGSVADGIKQVEAVAAQAGVPRTAWDIADGSGMSTYNRVSPRGMVALLLWVSAQPWGSAWRATLAVGGVDGTLARRFKGTVLEGKLFAKTGSLNATNALAGYMTAKSGRTLTFAFYANDVPNGIRATPAMDAALVTLAEAN